MNEVFGTIKDVFMWIWGHEQVQFTIDALIKLGITTILSGIIGFEREHSHRPAGFRTHILVAVGSALVMLTSVYIFESQGMTGDVTRMSAQVLSGIGFLGAGTILREGFSVKGLTTAAGIWTTSSVGLAIGAGYLVPSVIILIFIILSLVVIEKIEEITKEEFNEAFELMFETMKEYHYKIN